MVHAMIDGGDLLFFFEDQKKVEIIVALFSPFQKQHTQYSNEKLAWLALEIREIFNQNIKQPRLTRSIANNRSKPK